MSKKSDKIKRALLPAPSTKDEPMYLSTGCTVLNLAFTDKISGGFQAGKYYLFVGDSSSGKTWLCMTCFAEAMTNPDFEDYRLIFDNAEDGALMDIERYFGKKVAERLESPGKDSTGDDVHSSTVDQFFDFLEDACDTGKPFIYVLDSMDAISSEEEETKTQDNRKARTEGKETKGSFGVSKAKTISQRLRQVRHKLAKSKGILIIISQTRDNIDPMSFDTKTRAGGKALRFFATIEIWTSIKKQITKTVKGKNRSLGICTEVKIKKNRETGQMANVTVPIYHSVGIDDIGACVDYLVEEGHWSAPKGNIDATEFSVKGNREDIVKHVEDQGEELTLRRLVAKVWKEIRSKCVIERKPRYE